MFGVDILHVKEAVQHARVAQVPHAPRDLAGLVNIRGKLHLVVDLGNLFGFASRPDRDDASLVLFKPEVGEAVGVQVDSLGEVIPVDPKEIEDRRAGEASDVQDERRKARAGLALGVAKVPAGLLVLLDPKAISNCPKV